MADSLRQLVKVEDAWHASTHSRRCPCIDCRIERSDEAWR